MIAKRCWRILGWYDDTMLTTGGHCCTRHLPGTMERSMTKQSLTLLKILCVTVILLSEYVINKFLDFIASVSTIIA